MKASDLFKLEILLAAIFIASPAKSHDAWMKLPSDECRKNDESAIDDNFDSRKYIYEIPISKWDVVERDLNLTGEDFIKLGIDDARYYLGESYPEPKDGTSPYLVRALYAYGSTGDFTFSWCKDDIWISHVSLGNTWTENRSALILNLEKEPRQVFITVGVAE